MGLEQAEEEAPTGRAAEGEGSGDGGSERNTPIDETGDSSDCGDCGASGTDAAGDAGGVATSGAGGGAGAGAACALLPACPAPRVPCPKDSDLTSLF